MRKRWGPLILAAVMAAVLIGPAQAAAATVSVTLPAFPVSLNGVGIDNDHSSYPLLVYKDITYFPMTYYDSRFLGLESTWDSQRGLAVIKTGAAWDYHPYPSQAPNRKAYSAQVAGFPITVNGQAVENRSEEYPLLIFRNITYFPLTWRFAVNEFGWKYSFNPADGLVIDSASAGIAAGQLTLPIVDRGDMGKGALTLAGDYFYFEGQGGKIYQAPVSAPSALKEVYQLPTEFMWTGAPASLYTDQGRAILKYHTGGATMGSDHLIWLREDGAAQELDHGYSAFKMYDEYTVRVDHWAPPLAGNLQIKKRGETEYTNVGDPECYFGRFFIKKDSGLSSRPSYDLYLIGDEIYVLGCYRSGETSNQTGIYQVNIDTGTTIRLFPNQVAGFKIVADRIYFADPQQHLYRGSLTGGQAELLAAQAVDQYEILQGQVYYSSAADHQLYTLGSPEPVNPGGRLERLEIQEGYLIAIFTKDSESPYKMLIIDGDGQVLYQTVENVLLARIDRGRVVFVKDN
ncbi:MAG: DUF5050 domain-containing protein [Syntrophomonadaceae bacterium]